MVGVVVVKKMNYWLAAGLLSLSSMTASAGLVFDFTFEELPPYAPNMQIGDGISVAFNDFADFTAGVSWADIEYVAFDTGALGTGTISTDTSFASDETLAQFFSFTDVGNDVWQMDLLLGVTGTAGSMIFSEGDRSMQFGQTVSGGGATNFSLDTASGFQLLHNFESSFVLTSTASAAAVPEPSALGLLGLGLFALGARRAVEKR